MIAPAVCVGQVWRERGYQRHVLIEAIEGDRVRIRTCSRDGMAAVNSTTTARLDRFGIGYYYVSAAKVQP